MEVLRPYFQLGCAVNRACAYAGIPPTTVETWLKDDDDLRAKVTAWQNEISAKARANWRMKIASQDYAASKDWLERNEKDPFSTRQELTGPEGRELHPTPIMASYALSGDDGHEKDHGDAKKDPRSAGGNVGVEDDLDSLVPDQPGAV